MDIDKIEKIDGQYFISEEINEEELQNEVSELQEAKVYLQDSLQQETDRVNAEIAEIDAKITKLQNLLA